jgi:Ni,Fe-hydrogenase maturation factor
MGGRREKAQTTHQGDVRGATQDVEEQDGAQKKLIWVLLSTIRHFFGDFSPTVQEAL